jgi:hypothetical protein
VLVGEPNAPIGASRDRGARTILPACPGAISWRCSRWWRVEAQRLPVELSQHCLGQLVRVELAGTGKLHNPYCHKISDGKCLGPGQPQCGAHLLESLKHRVDLVGKKWGRATALSSIGQLRGSLRGSPLVRR